MLPQPHSEICAIDTLNLPRELGEFMKGLRFLLTLRKTDYVKLADLIESHDYLFKPPSTEVCKALKKPDVHSLLSTIPQYISLRSSAHGTLIKLLLSSPFDNYRESSNTYDNRRKSSDEFGSLRELRNPFGISSPRYSPQDGRRNFSASDGGASSFRSFDQGSAFGQRFTGHNNREPYDPFKFDNTSVTLAAFQYTGSLHVFNGNEMIQNHMVFRDIHDFPFSETILSNAQKMRIDKLTTCQSIVLPSLLEEFKDRDHVIITPRLSGLTSAVAFPLTSQVYQFKRTVRRPMDEKLICPIAMVITENVAALKQTSRVFSQVAFNIGVFVQGFWSKELKADLARCYRRCDILILTPQIFNSLLADDVKFDFTFLKYVFVDWADKVMKSFGIRDTCNMLAHISNKNTVRILGYEYLYDSRKFEIADILRQGAMEIRIEKSSN